jgi:hypothetical protein
MVGRVQSTIPHLSFAGARYVAAGGRELLACLDCPSGPELRIRQPGVVAATTPDWLPDALTAWGVPVDVSFASDDVSLWILFRQPSAAVLARASGRGRLELVASVPIDPDTTYAFLGRLAADDSLLTISLMWVDPDAVATIVIDPATGGAVTTSDTVVGVVTDPVAPAP